MKKYIYLVIPIFLFSCKQNKTEPNVSGQTYFDVKGYFEAEAKRLQSLNPTINKEVSINYESEQKTLQIADWNKELEIFIAADINKADWRGQFKEVNTPQKISYNTENEKVFVKNLEVYKVGGQVQKIFVIINRKNLVYNSIDTLKYIPDSLYEIKKSQKIKLLDLRNYAITGRF